VVVIGSNVFFNQDDAVNRKPYSTLAISTKTTTGSRTVVT